MTQINEAKKPRKGAPAKKTAQKRKPGRPSSYTQEIAERICDLIATSDKGLDRICTENPDLPHRDTIRLWCWKHPDFYVQYKRAREMQQLWMGEKALQVAADGTNDIFIDDDGKVRVDTDVIQRSRLIVDTIKWQASKLAPKVFGDKIDVNHDVPADSPLAQLFQQVAGTPFKPSGD